MMIGGINQEFRPSTYLLTYLFFTKVPSWYHTFVVFFDLLCHKLRRYYTFVKVITGISGTQQVVGRL